ILLETGNLGDPVAVLNSCTRGILKVWGLDPVEHDTLTRLPRWLNRPEIVRAIVARYPAKALRKGEQGIFRMRVTVEKDGSVSECDLDSATITESLQSPACKEMLKARFAPALDKDGQPMRSFRMANIIYQIS
ncbi:MAG TPA: TonB family protein, partial [Erythrobacter sp.]|nr:TonB family protein [Erythrobacter sp.]